MAPSSNAGPAAQGKVAPVPAQGDGATRSSERPEGTYVYGVIGSSWLEPGIKSALGGEGAVYAVNYADISAVASPTPVFILDPTRDYALAHEHVIETVMKNHTVIPMSFGTVFRTDEDVRAFLRKIYPTLKKVLKAISGKVEFGLKVTWDRDRIVEELKRDHPDIRRFYQELTQKKLQATYFARRQLGRMIDRAVAELAASHIQTIYEGLRPVAAASRDSKLIGDKMILNTAFLVERKREAEFDDLIHRVAHKLGDRLHFKSPGPWPPYNFVSIHLKVEKGRAG